MYSSDLSILHSFNFVLLLLSFFSLYDFLLLPITKYNRVLEIKNEIKNSLNIHMFNY